MEPEDRLALLPDDGTQGAGEPKLSSFETRSSWSFRGGSRRVEEGGISAYFNTDHLVEEKKSFSRMRSGEERDCGQRVGSRKGVCQREMETYRISCWSVAFVKNVLEGRHKEI